MNGVQCHICCSIDVPAAVGSKRVEEVVYGSGLDREQESVSTVAGGTYTEWYLPRASVWRSHSVPDVYKANRNLTGQCA